MFAATGCPHPDHCHSIDLAQQQQSAPRLAELEEAKRKLALSENSVWVTTGIPTIRPVQVALQGKLVTRFRVHMLKYSGGSNKKGSPVCV